MIVLLLQISGFGESLKMKDGNFLRMNPNFEVPIEWTAPEVSVSRVSS